MTLRLDPCLDPEEMEYTSASLDFTKQEIMRTLDIIDVARRLGIELSELPNDSDERKEYKSENVYTGNCPYCNEGEWNLRIFSPQTYWCLNCDWDGELSDSHDIFQFLEHFYDSDVGDKKKIETLFELFPEELAHLAENDLYQYTYGWDYFSESDKYYPGIVSDVNQLDWEIKYVLERNRNYEYLEPLRSKRGILHTIIRSHEIVSQIYARQAKILAMLSGKPISEVLWHELEDEFSDWNMAVHSLKLEEAWVDHDVMSEVLKGIYQAEEQAEEDRRKAEKDAEAARLLAEKQAQARRQEELERTRNESLQELWFDLVRYKDELEVFSRKRDVFFASCNYECIGEQGESLSAGDFGKFVFVYQKESQKFSVIISSRKSQSALPKTIEEAKRQTYTRDMPSDTGSHKDITIPQWARRFGWAQYIIGSKPVDGNSLPNILALWSEKLSIEKNHEFEMQK